MIQSHLYAKQNRTPVYSHPSVEGEPFVFLMKGDWLGVVERKADGWMRVIGTSCNGWVRTVDLEAQSPFNLHAVWTDDQSIQYISRRA